MFETIEDLHTCVIGPLCSHADGWSCKKQQFLDDPITIAYGVGGEMLHLIDCPGCVEDGWCGHDSCEAIMNSVSDCKPCLAATYEIYEQYRAEVT